MDVVEIGKDTYRVTSESAADKTYIVDLTVPNCSCTWWATQRNKLVKKARQEGKPDNSVHFECKHILACKGGAANLGKRTPKAPPGTVNKRTSAAEARKKADAIVAKFKAPDTKERMLATLREAALKKDK